MRYNSVYQDAAEVTLKGLGQEMRLAYTLHWQNVLCLILGILVLRTGFVEKQFESFRGGEPIPAWQGRLWAFVVGGFLLVAAFFAHKWH
jgi:hypothetical protein